MPEQPDKVSIELHVLIYIELAVVGVDNHHLAFCQLF